MTITHKNNQPERLPVIEVKEINWQKAHLFFAREVQSTQVLKENKAKR